MKTLIIDIESGSAKDLFRTRRGDFNRLYGYMWEGEEPRVTTDPEEFKEALREASRIVNFNGMSFDMPSVAYHDGADFEELAKKTIDLMIVEIQVDPPSAKGMPKGYYGLDQTAKRLGHDGKFGDLQELASEFGGFDQIPVDDERYVDYLKGDLRATEFVWLKRRSDVVSDPYIKREHSVMKRMIKGPKIKGFRVWEEELNRRLQEQSERKSKNFQRIRDDYGIPLGRWKHFKKEGRAPRWEPFSAPFRTLEGLAALERNLAEFGAGKMRRTDGGKDGKNRQISTNRENLEAAMAFYSSPGRMSDFKIDPGSVDSEGLNEFLQLVIDITTERTVYDTIAKHTIDGWVHPEIVPEQASGRWSVRDPGLTVLGKKKGKWVERQILLPDNEDHVIIAVDMDQVDARVIAGLCQDPAYMSLFEPGKDLHSEVAMRIFGRCDGEYRERAKIGAHGFSYGLGPKGLSAQMGVSREVAEQFVAGMRDEFPVLAQWKQQNINLAKSGELLQTEFGRKMRPDPERAPTQGPGLSGQGGTRDLMAQWVLNLEPEHAEMLKVVVHDEGIFSVPRVSWEEHAKQIVAAATMDFRDVPITAGVSGPADTWGDVYAK